MTCRRRYSLKSISNVFIILGATWCNYSIDSNGDGSCLSLVLQFVVDTGTLLKELNLSSYPRGRINWPCFTTLHAGHLPGQPITTAAAAAAAAAAADDDDDNDDNVTRCGYHCQCVTQVEVDKVDKVLVEQAAVTEVYIRGWKVDDVMMAILAECFPAVTSLHTVDLWNVGLTDVTLAKLANVLARCRALRTLALDANCVPSQRWQLLIEVHCASCTLLQKSSISLEFNVRNSRHWKFLKSLWISTVNP